MLDINLFREERGGNPELVRESQRRRYADVSLVDKVLELDAQWREARGSLDTLNMEFNKLNKEIATLRKPNKGQHCTAAVYRPGPAAPAASVACSKCRPGGMRPPSRSAARRSIAPPATLRRPCMCIPHSMQAKQDASALQERSKEMKLRIKEAEELEKRLSEERDAAIVPIGNLVPDSVPVDDNEDNNAVVKEWGQKRNEEAAPEKLYSHVDLVQLLDIVDLEAGAEVAGNRGYYLKNEGVLLNQALINCALQFGYRRGFSPVHTPFFMQKPIMAECAQLSQFDEELYKVTGEGEDKYLIATSEQTLCAMHRKNWFEKGQLPIKYVGYSTCFRKEAGSHGRDTLGIFRVHQFEKVEQFVITSPHDDESWKALEEMIGNAEAFYQALGFPYRVVNIVSGALNDAAAKKYDLEAWFPASRTHRELVSCSNCTDYQSRRLEIRLRSQQVPGGESKKEYVHMLNGTLSATSRTMCCLLENYQTPDGVRVPEVLQPFMMGMDFIPFRKQFDAKGKLVDRPAPAAKPAADAAASMSTS